MDSSITVLVCIRNFWRVLWSNLKMLITNVFILLLELIHSHHESPHIMWIFSLSLRINIRSLRIPLFKEEREKEKKKESLISSLPLILSHIKRADKHSLRLPFIFEKTKILITLNEFLRFYNYVFISFILWMNLY